MKGLFIVVEGFEGTGKTTLTNELAEHFKKQGREVELCRQPGGTPFAEGIRTLLKDTRYQDEDVCPVTEYLLFCAARNQLVKRVIEPALEAGKVVICDRHYLSSHAYQDYKLSDVEDIVSKEPDITIFVDRPFKRAVDTMGGRNESCRIEGRGLEYLHSVYCRYHREWIYGNHGYKITLSFGDFDSPEHIEAKREMYRHLNELAAPKVCIEEWERQVEAAERVRVIIRGASSANLPPYSGAPNDNETYDAFISRIKALLPRGTTFVTVGRYRHPKPTDLMKCYRLFDKQVMETN